MSASHWWSLLARLLVMTAIGLLAGLFFGHALLGATLMLGLLLLWQLSRLHVLVNWLRANQLDAAPDMAGPWGEAIALTGRLFRRKQFHKQRLLRLLRELRESTAAMPDGVVVLNPQAEIIWFNRTAARLLSLRGRGDIGLRIENLVRQPEFVRYMRAGDFSGSVVMRATAGAEQYLSVQIVPYGAGQLLMLVRDVTGQARLEAMRKDFVANASHELRSPLTVISGYLETLTQDSSVDPGLAGPLQEMRRQAQRMTAVVNDLLELSRLEATERAVTGVPIDVAALAAQLRQDVLARATHPASVQIQIDSDARLVGEESAIHSAFSNLVDNAAKYTPPTGAITIRWSVDDAGGHFAVTDSGIGIASEHLPRLTERFYRADAGRSRATGGSGLGLSIVKHVLQRHGGSLSIDSVEGKGSTFICHFPSQRIEQPA